MNYTAVSNSLGLFGNGHWSDHGYRRINPDAPVLVVVAEILLNRLLNPDSFDFSESVLSSWMNFIHSMIPNEVLFGN